MIQRLAANLVRERLRQSPAVGLVGPRQCGKTTLARSFPGRYFDLEVEAERLRLDLQWASLVQGKELIILDEAQAWPEVFPRLRSAIDQDRKTMGRFLLLGSVSPGLAKQVSESLAGRLSLVELTASPSLSDIRHLNKVADPIQADQRVLVARVQESLESEGLLVTNLPGLLEKLRALKP
ncbi:MAG: AAA family ATPase [Planctomycetes bacterium]|nr:AAA family ATPase [Planctomycetota bacterium]